MNVWQSTKMYFRSIPLEQAAERLVYKYTNQEDVIGIQDPYLNSVFPARLWRFRFYAFFGISNIDWQENLHRYLFIQKIFNQPWEKIDRELLSEPDTILSPLKTVTVPYLLSFKRYIPKEERQKFKKFYDALGKDFLNTKKLDYILCLGSKDERNLLLGIKNLGIDIRLIAKDGDVSLYRLE